MNRDIARRNPATPHVPARYYAVLCERLRLMDVDVARMLRAAGIRQSEIFGPNASLSLDKMESLLSHAAAVTGREDLGFELGLHVKLTSHDILGYGFLSSPTLEYALRLASRFYRLILPMFSTHYQRIGQHAELQHHAVLSMSPAALRFHVEAIVASRHCAMVALLGEHLHSYDIHFSGFAPAHHRRYRELAPARCHFEGQSQHATRMVIATAMVDRPLALADSAALAMVEARCEAKLERMAQAGNVSDWVAMMLREANEGMPTLKELAHLLHVGPHTLDRRLRKEGHGFLELSKRVRQERSCELLQQGRMSISQVAYQLGYSDVANFTRAFRRANGITPSEYQRRRPSRQLRR